jgi:hypothetical protein
MMQGQKNIKLYQDLEGGGRDVLILSQVRLEGMRKISWPRVEAGTYRIPARSVAAAVACWESQQRKYGKNI